MDQVVHFLPGNLKTSEQLQLICVGWVVSFFLLRVFFDSKHVKMFFHVTPLKMIHLESPTHVTASELVQAGQQSQCSTESSCDRQRKNIISMKNGCSLLVKLLLLT